MAFANAQKSSRRGAFASGGSTTISVTPAPNTTAANSSIPAPAAPSAAQIAANTDAGGFPVMPPATAIAQPAFSPQPFSNAVSAAPSLASLSGDGSNPYIASVNSQGIPAGSPAAPKAPASGGASAFAPPVAPPTSSSSSSSAAPTAAQFAGIQPGASAYGMVNGSLTPLFTTGNGQYYTSDYGGFSGLYTGSLYSSPNEGLTQFGTASKRGGTIHPRKLAGGGIPTSEALDPWYTRAEERSLVHPEGLVNSMGAGRTDIHPISVPAGSYIMPADVVSGLAEGNTMAGAGVIDKMMHSMPYGINGSGQKFGRGPPPAPRSEAYKEPPDNLNALQQPVARGGKIRRAEGGGTQQPAKGHGEMVPIVVAGGEHIIYPQTIIQKFGDLKKGHQVLDKFVIKQRQQTIKDMRKLKPPKR